MKLIDKISKSKFVSKMIIPDKVIYKDFDANYEINKNRVDADFLEMQKDIINFKRDKTLKINNKNFLEQKTEVFNVLLSQTNSKSFAHNMSEMVTVFKWYAVYYRSTDKTNNKKEIKKIAKNLYKLYDMIVWASLSHLIREKGYKFVSFDGNTFSYDKEGSYSGKFINVTVNILNNVVKFTNAMCENDVNETYHCYKDMCNIETFNMITSEDIFGL